VARRPAGEPTSTPGGCSTSRTSGRSGTPWSRRGKTGVHHLLDGSGRTAFYIEPSADYDHARWLVRLSYLYHVNVLKKSPAGVEEFAAVGVESELDELGPSDPIGAAFERRRPGRAGTPE
jgi:hypothetical protein